MTDDLRQLVRSLVLEELASQGVAAGPAGSRQTREEVVTIDTDQDLSRFVQRLLAMARNENSRAEIESGRHVFRLSRGGGAAPRSAGRPASARGKLVRFESGLVTEKQVRNLPEDVAAVEAGIGVRFTPLASDALRQAGIKIKRVKK